MARPSRALPLFLSGMLLLLLGAVWTSIETQSFLPRLVTAAGGLLSVIFIVRHASEIRFLLLQFRTHAEPGPTTTLMLVAIVLIMGAVLCARLVPFIDLTAERINSLSPASRAALEALEEPLELQGFFANPSPIWDHARQVLDLYARSSTRISYSLHDPDREPGIAREAGVTQPGVVIVTYREAKAEVFELTEEALTQGLLRALSGRPRKVGFIQGHGEPLLSSGGGEGITAWIQALRDVNVVAEPINLLRDGVVAPDIDALLLVSPQSVLLPVERGAVQDFLESGGGLGIWLEPGDSTGLEQYLEFHYVKMLPGTVRDRGPITRRLGYGEWTPALAANPRHAIGAEMLGIHIAAPEIRSFAIDTPHPMDLTLEPLLMTAPDAEVMPSCAQPDATPLAQGTQMAGVLLEWEIPGHPAVTADGLPPMKRRARIALIGDASMVTNRYFGVGANHQLAVNTAHWLTWQERFLDINRRFRESTRLKIGPRGLRMLLYILQIGMPLALLGAGLGVWLRRRERA